MNRGTLHYALGFVLFFAAWWGGSYLIGPAVLPSPAAVGRYLATDGVVQQFLATAWLTIRRGLAGFGAAWLVALPLGIAMGRHRAGERIGFFPLFLLQSAPPLFWITPLVLLLGTRGPVAPLVAFLVSLPLLTVHTLMAIKHIRPHEYDLFAVYAPRATVVARELYLPKLLPALKSNVHLGILVAIKAAMLAEWFAAQNGFGQTIRIHYQFFAMIEFLSWALLFLLLVGGGSLALKAALARWLPVQRPTALKVARRTAPTATAGVGGSNDRSCDTLAVDGLTFGYNETALFSNVSFAVTRERPLVIHGRSGCGKTTLLKCIAGLVKPWHGAVRCGDTAAGSGTAGLVFQADALLEHRDAVGNVLLPALPKPSPGEISRAEACLRLWGLGDRANAFPAELSGGMRKRVAMARAWFLGAATIVLDEPFVHLDREARTALWRLLFERLQQQEMTALIVTHYPEELTDYDCEIRSWDQLIARPASSADSSETSSR